jgi:ribosomal protein S1
VVRLADFGAFVELERGVEALAPAREFPPATEDWRQGLEPGSSLAWRVLSVDVARRRIAIVPDSEWVERGLALDLNPGSRLKGRVQNVEKFGVFVWLAPGKVGLVPTPWTGAPRGADLAKEFPRGREVEVEIVEVGDEGKKIRLTMDSEATRQAAEQAERARAGDERRASEPPAPKGARAAETPASEPGSPPASFGTSLGDALKSALEKRNRG